ncbi:MAG TPA: hypothetical protein VJB14_12170 [Planctomycetota bacterium]|nr:hypothetical protein [Planctomycetota bacterium]
MLRSLLIPTVAVSVFVLGSCSEKEVHHPKFQDAALFMNFKGEGFKRICPLFNPATAPHDFRQMVSYPSSSQGDTIHFETTFRWEGTSDAGDLWSFAISAPKAAKPNTSLKRTITYSGSEVSLLDDPMIRLVVRRDVTEPRSQ